MHKRSTKKGGVKFFWQGIEQGREDLRGGINGGQEMDPDKGAHCHDRSMEPVLVFVCVLSSYLVICLDFVSHLYSALF